MKFLQDFKEFAVKGNMTEMAIGIIIGAAFNAIVNSLVKDIIMPVFGFITGNIDLRDRTYVLQELLLDDQGQVIKEAIAIRYGNFIQVFVDFLIIGFSIFIAVRFANRLKRKSEDPKSPTPTPRDIELLSEIRDLLKERTRQDHSGSVPSKDR